jgi:hypothetical protein
MGIRQVNFYDIYLEAATIEKVTEGHAPDQIYARVPVTDTKGEVLTYLCRVNENQLRYLDKEQVPYTTWNTVDVSGKRKDIKVKIKDKENKDKDIPTIVFGTSMSSPECPIITPTKDIDSTAIIEKPKAISSANILEIDKDSLVKEK